MLDDIIADVQGVQISSSSEKTLHSCPALSVLPPPSGLLSSCASSKIATNSLLSPLPVYQSCLKLSMATTNPLASPQSQVTLPKLSSSSSVFSV